jgi:CRP-like cAMP-binding protein
MHSLIESISKYIEPSKSLIYYLNDKVEEVSFSKGDLVLDANNICKNSYFIVSGIFRLYFIKPDGKEVSEFFASKKEWINSPMSFIQQKQDDYFIDAIEDTVALSLSVENLVYLFDHYPEMERYARLDMGSVFVHMMNRLASLRFTDAKEKYDYFCENHTEINQRIPLHMVASYMGVTQETLSRIRSRKNTV